MFAGRVIETRTLAGRVYAESITYPNYVIVLDGGTIAELRYDNKWYVASICSRDYLNAYAISNKKGPAIEHSDGTFEWFISGEKMSKIVYQDRLNKNKG